MTVKPLRCALLAALLALPATLSADSGPNLRLEVDGDDGERVRLELSAGWLSALARHATFDCDGSDDRRTRAMAETLDRRGEGGVYEYEASDGDQVVARRRRGQLVLETRQSDGEQARVEMPWPLAECLMLGREPAGGFAAWLANEGLTLRIDARDGEGSVRIRFD